MREETAVPASGWDTAYEVRAVALLSLGFGLVGLDRYMILPMFPTIMQALHLSYQDLGEITGALSLTWGLAALFAGRLSDAATAAPRGGTPERGRLVRAAGLSTSYLRFGS